MTKKSNNPPKASGGRRGPRGKRGALASEELHTLIRKVDKIQDQAAIRFTRLAQIQAQVDRALKDISATAGRHRKKR
jgi:hypothetical protein